MFLGAERYRFALTLPETVSGTVRFCAPDYILKSLKEWRSGEIRTPGLLVRSKL